MWGWRSREPRRPLGRLRLRSYWTGPEPSGSPPVGRTNWPFGKMMFVGNLLIQNLSGIASDVLGGCVHSSSFVEY